MPIDPRPAESIPSVVGPRGSGVGECDGRHAPNCTRCNTLVRLAATRRVLRQAGSAYQYTENADSGRPPAEPSRPTDTTFDWGDDNERAGERPWPVGSAMGDRRVGDDSPVRRRWAGRLRLWLLRRDSRLLDRIRRRTIRSAGWAGIAVGADTDRDEDRGEAT